MDYAKRLWTKFFGRGKIYNLKSQNIIGILAHKTSDEDFFVYACDNIVTAVKLQDDIRERDPGIFSETEFAVIITEKDIPRVLKEIFGDE